ncbi:unnamed protein product [Lathyrus oleraceus]
MSSYYLKGESIGRNVSTCDGILCYMIGNSSVLLCNPSTRKFITLPFLKFPHQGNVEMIYTLLYDRFIHSYKVIALNAHHATNREVYVHILGTHCWTRIQDFPSPHQLLFNKDSSLTFEGPREGIFVSDSVNWLVSAFIVSLDLEKGSYQKRRVSGFIVSLDLEKGSYQKLSLPVSNLHFTASCFVRLGTLRGCLSYLLSGASFADIWIMKEFANQKSWTKLFTVPYLESWGFFRIPKVLYISEDDQVLMETLMIGIRNHRVLVYDSINNTYSFPEFQNNIRLPLDTVLQVYVESLISPF